MNSPERRIAALPMYDFPDRESAHDALWQALARRLDAGGVEAVPQSLTRYIDHTDTWRHPGLLFGQACEYPLATSPELHVRLVATPHYEVPGCEDARYSSAIIVRNTDPAASIAELRSGRCAVNQMNSNSGMNLLRATLAPIVRRERFFDRVAVSGSHLASAMMVADGRADVAAIDCVSYAHFRRFAPELSARLRILAWTESSPSLPLITAAATDQATLKVLRQALLDVARDSAAAPALRQLYLSGFDVKPETSFAEVLRLQHKAVALGYPVLR